MLHSCGAFEERRGHCRQNARIATGEDGANEQRPPSGVAVCTIYYETVYSACRHLHRMVLWIGDWGSSNDRVSLVGGALERIFQPLCDQIEHHIPPSCTAVVWDEEHGSIR
jgi:hypothetical protein